MAKFRGAVVVDKEKCKGCNLCVVACPTKTLDLAKEVNGKGYHYSEMVNPRRFGERCKVDASSDWRV